LITGLFFGLAPAWLAAHTKLNETLKAAGRGSTHGRRRRFRAGFVVAQVALAVVLLVGASLLLRSFVRLQNLDLGFQTDHVLTAALSMPDARFPGRDEQRMAFLSRLVERVSALPGVVSASSVMGLPVGFVGASTAFYFDGRPMPEPSAMLIAGYSQVSANYFETMKTSILRGRQFEPRDTVTAPYVTIVNEAFVRAFLDGQEPIGRRVFVMDSRRGRPTEIVGVVRDVRQRDIVKPAGPEMYFPSTQRCWADAQLVIRTHGDPSALTAALRRAVIEVDPAQTIFLVRTLAEVRGDAVALRRLQMILLSIFAGLALLLAAVGIYGVMSYGVAQRTQEIGVRISLGAQRGHVLGMILRQGMGLTALGVAVGLIGAFALTRLMRSLLFEVSPTDPLIFSLIPLALIAVAGLASWLPARRAARLDPLKALRSE
jgi:putative ABC transport system permease protein